MGLLPSSASVSGRVLLNGEDLLAGGETTMRPHRWVDIAIVFQGAMNAFNPVRTVGDQIVEALETHAVARGASAKRRVGELLESVGIPAQRAGRFPHELSGGMRQRAAIAMALACDPKVLIADEPTTALDVMVQAQILELLDALCRDFGLALVLVTHDLPVVAQLCDLGAVMYAGRIVERAGVDQLYHRPRHPYTRMLFAATPDLTDLEQPVVSIPGAPPRLDRPLVGCPFRPRCDSAFAPCEHRLPALLTLEDGGAAACHLDRVLFRYEPPRSRRPVRSLSDPARARRHGAAGAAGDGACRGRRVVPPRRGRARRARRRVGLRQDVHGPGGDADGRRERGLDPLRGPRPRRDRRRAQMRPLRRRLQMVYQDPYESLDPRQTVRQAVEEPLLIHGLGGSQSERVVRVSDALERVELTPAELFLGRFPHELSGGQRQRVAIAAALVLEPALLVADEPVSMLDVSVRAGVLTLLDRLKQSGLAILMITHDLSTAARFADRIAVMYLGRIVEQGSAADVVHNPQHPYTKALLSVVPRRDPRERHTGVVLRGETPDAVRIPTGCRFHPRCPVAVERCSHDEPQLAPTAPGHDAACLLL